MTLRLAANLSTLFTDLPFLERFGAAAAAGFRGVEAQFPYDTAAEDIARQLQQHRLAQVLMNAPAGDMKAGERGIAANPRRVEEFRDTIRVAQRYLAATRCHRLHVLGGKLPPGEDAARWRAQLVANLKWAADLLAEEGTTVLVEAINTRIDVPGYLIDNSTLALECIRAVGRPNVKLQYDVYHMTIMEGDVVERLESLLPWIGHVQIADHPGRHEPGTGTIDFGAVLRKLVSIGYTGWIGCEYVPARDTASSLGWARSYLQGG